MPYWYTVTFHYFYFYYSKKSGKPAPCAVKTVNSVDIWFSGYLYFVLLHIPLGIATFSFHWISCVCMWPLNFLNPESRILGRQAGVSFMCIRAPGTLNGSFSSVVQPCPGKEKEQSHHWCHDSSETCLSVCLNSFHDPWLFQHACNKPPCKESLCTES